MCREGGGGLRKIRGGLLRAMSTLIIPKTGSTSTILVERLQVSSTIQVNSLSTGVVV